MNTSPNRVACLLAGLALSNALWAVQGALAPLAPDGQPVGSVVPWQGFAAGGSPPYEFRFESAPGGASFTILKDFSKSNSLEWTPMQEGEHRVRLTVRDSSGDTAQQTLAFNVSSRVSGGQPTVSAVLHPLVALYSAPSCNSGAMRVRFRAAGTAWWSVTPFRACAVGSSLDFLVAGMRADTDYEMQHELYDGSGSGVPTLGPLLTFHSGIPSTTFPVFIPQVLPNAQTSFGEPVVLSAVSWTATGSAFPVATDLWGRVIWYYKRAGGTWDYRANLMRPVPGGTFLMTVNQAGVSGQLLREINVAGNTLRETNAARVSEQIVAMGGPPIGAFHHEVVRLANGHTMALASVEKTLVDVQGPGPVNVLGDAIVELDENWQVVWYWDSFEHLDTSRKAILGEVCSGPATGCPTLFASQQANDWLHSNTITYTPDGNLLLSLKSQDWVVKIDYQDGAGTGDVLWRLGRGGDFSLDSDEPFPWFSHQHDVRIDGDSIIVYDNSNTWRALNPAANSRGQVYSIDDQTMTATLELNADLGHFAEALGSAEPLSNGSYHFLSGLLTPGLYSQSLEYLPSGQQSYVLEIWAGVYRAFRMRDLYTPIPH